MFEVKSDRQRKVAAVAAGVIERLRDRIEEKAKRRESVMSDAVTEIENEGVPGQFVESMKSRHNEERNVWKHALRHVTDVLDEVQATIDAYDRNPEKPKKKKKTPRADREPKS